MPRDVPLDAELSLDQPPLDQPLLDQPQSLDLTITVEQPGRVLALRGRLSARTVAEGRAALVEAIAVGSEVLVIDISGLQLVDASGLGMLVGAHRLALRNERELVLRGVPERIERLLAVTRLNRVLRAEDPIRV